MLRAEMEREARVSLAAYRCLYPGAVELGGVTVLRADEAPLSPMLNRIVGLGVDEPATEAALDEALAAIGDDVSCYVAVAPGARPAALSDWLRGRGLEPGWGWMSFRRGVDTVPDRRPRSARQGRAGRGDGLRRDRRNRLRPAGRRRAVGRRRLPASAGTAGSRSTATSPRPPPGCSSAKASAISASPRRCPSTAARAAQSALLARTDPARPRVRLRRPRHRDGRAAGRPAPRTRTATSCAPGSPRSR